MVPRVSEVARIFLVAAFLVLVAQGSTFSTNRAGLVAAANCTQTTGPNGGIITKCDEPNANKEVTIDGKGKSDTKITDECTQENIATWRKSGSVALQQKAQACESKSGIQTAVGPDGKKLDVTCKEGDKCGAVTQGSGGASSPSAAAQYAASDAKPYISQMPLTPPDAYTSKAINDAFPGVSDGSTKLAYPIETPKSPDASSGGTVSEVSGITLAPTQPLNQSTLTERAVLSPSYATPQSAYLDAYLPVTSGATLASTQGTGFLPSDTGPLWNYGAPLGGMSPFATNTLSPSEIFFGQSAPVASYALNGTEFPITIIDPSGNTIATLNGEDYGFSEKGSLTIRAEQLAGQYGMGTLAERIENTLVKEFQTSGVDGELARAWFELPNQDTGRTLAQDIATTLAENENQKNIFTKLSDSFWNGGGPPRLSVAGTVDGAETPLSLALQENIQGPAAPTSAEPISTPERSQGILNQDNDVIRTTSQSGLPGTQSGGRPTTLNQDNPLLSQLSQQGSEGTQSGKAVSREPITVADVQIISKSDFEKLTAAAQTQPFEPLYNKQLPDREVADVRDIPGSTPYTQPSGEKTTTPQPSVASAPKPQQGIAVTNAPTSATAPDTKIQETAGASGRATDEGAAASPSTSSGTENNQPARTSQAENPFTQFINSTPSAVKKAGQQLTAALQNPRQFLNEAFKADVPSSGPAPKAVADPTPKLLTTIEGTASCYDPTNTTSCGGTAFEGGMLTATGKYVGNKKPTAALQLATAKELKCGYAGKKCTALVTDVTTGKSVVVTIDDNGPLFKDRVIDLSSEAMEQLGGKDIAKVKVEIFEKGTTLAQAEQVKIKSATPAASAEPSPEQEERDLQKEAASLGVSPDVYQIPKKTSIASASPLPQPMLLGGPQAEKESMATPQETQSGGGGENTLTGDSGKDTLEDVFGAFDKGVDLMRQAAADAEKARAAWSKTMGQQAAEKSEEGTKIAADAARQMAQQPGITPAQKQILETAAAEAEQLAGRIVQQVPKIGLFSDAGVPVLKNQLTQAVTSMRSGIASAQNEIAQHKKTSVPVAQNTPTSQQPAPSRLATPTASLSPQNQPATSPAKPTQWSPDAWTNKTPSVEQARAVIRDVSQLYAKHFSFDASSFNQSMNAVFQIETDGVPNAKNESNNRYEGSFQLGPNEYKNWIAQAQKDLAEMQRKGIVSKEQYDTFKKVLTSTTNDPRFNHLLNTVAALSEHARSETKIQKHVSDPRLRAAFHQGVQLIPTLTKKTLAEGADKTLGTVSAKALAQNNITGVTTVMDAVRKMATGANGFAKKIAAGIARAGGIEAGAISPTYQAPSVQKISVRTAATSPITGAARPSVARPISLCIGSTNCTGINANNYINSLCQSDRGCTAQNLGAQPDKTYDERIMTDATERAADYVRQIAAAGKYSNGNQPVLIDNCQFAGTCTEIRTAIQKWNTEHPDKTLIPMVNNPLLVAENLGQSAAQDLMRTVAQMGGGAILENGAGSLKENDAFRKAIGYASMPILALANPEGGKRLAEEIIGNALENIGTSISSEIEGGSGYRDGMAGLPIALGTPETGVAERALTNYARGLGDVVANLTPENAEATRQKVEAGAQDAVTRGYQAAQLNSNPALAGLRGAGEFEVRPGGEVYKVSEAGGAEKVGNIARVTPPTTPLSAMPSRFFGADKFSGINPVIARSMNEASKLLPEGYSVRVKSASRVTSTVSNSFHMKRDAVNNSLAVDVTLVDPSGRELANIRAPENFGLYREFMQNVKAVQDQLYPDLKNMGRWGGYFVSGVSQDLMHYDLGPKNVTAAGNWENGLKPEYSYFGKPSDINKGMGSISEYKIPSVAQPESYDEFRSSDQTTTVKIGSVQNPGKVEAKIVQTEDGKLDIEIEYTPPTPPAPPTPTIAERAWQAMRDTVAPVQQKMQDMFKQIQSMFGGGGQSGGSKGGGSGSGSGGSPSTPSRQNPQPAPIPTPPSTPERGSFTCTSSTVIHNASTTPLRISWKCPADSSATGAGFSTGGAREGNLSITVATTSTTARYALTCSGSVPQTLSCAVRVLHPVVALVSRPNEVPVGESVLLRWNALDVQSCELYAPPSLIMMRGGMQGEAKTLPLTQTSEFAVRCKAGEGVWIAASTTVRIEGYAGHTLKVELPVE